MSLAPATEIVVSLMSQHADEQGNRQLHDDPRTYIFKTSGISIPQDIFLAVVENTDTTVNLALPFYSGVEDEFAVTVDDEDMTVAAAGASGYHADFWFKVGRQDNPNPMSGLSLGLRLAGGKREWF